MSSDDPTTPRPARRPASSRLPGASPQLNTELASTPLAAIDGISAIRLSGAVFLAFSPDEAAELCDAVGAVVNDPTAEERYGERAMVHLSGLAEALSDALGTTRVRRSAREIHPEA